MTTTPSDDEVRALDALDARVRALLPPEYQDSYESLQPVPMKSAGLTFGTDGTVAWDRIWGSFCDLAMAGGPPHKGRLLRPAGHLEIDAHTRLYTQVTDEICRGVTLATGLTASRSAPGWVRVHCHDEGMAGWLHRAIIMENVSARRSGAWLDLPAGPQFRLDKEIRNVVTVIAKTAHYWLQHMPLAQRRGIAGLLAAMNAASPLIEPAAFDESAPTDDDARARAASSISGIGLDVSPQTPHGWSGIECRDVPSAVWMMRALVTHNVLSRREDATLFVPLNPGRDPEAAIVTRALEHVARLAIARGRC